MRAPRGEHLLNGVAPQPPTHEKKVHATLAFAGVTSRSVQSGQQPRAEPGPRRCAQSLTITTACACRAHRPQRHLLAAEDETRPPPSGTQQNRGPEGGQRSGSSGGARGGGAGREQWEGLSKQLWVPETRAAHGRMSTLHVAGGQPRVIAVSRPVPQVACRRPGGRSPPSGFPVLLQCFLTTAGRWGPWGRRESSRDSGAGWELGGQ